LASVNLRMSVPNTIETRTPTCVLYVGSMVGIIVFDAVICAQRAENRSCRSDTSKFAHRERATHKNGISFSPNTNTANRNQRWF